MNLETRKIEFVQEFLKLQSEEAISLLEKTLIKGKNNTEQQIGTISKEDLTKRIIQSEKDFDNNRFKTSSDLLAKYQ